MDILESIRDKISLIGKRTSKIDLSDLLLHLERAEYYFKKGKETGDENYYTDVIYRTNQVFEGGLREVYKVLVKKNKPNISTQIIENYLLDKELLKTRVLDFFTHYRRNWRNESTHNYRLSFNESEALMAITTVSSFTYVLITQIPEALAFQKESTINIDKQGVKKLLDDSKIEIDEKVVSLVKLFYSQNSKIIKENKYNELEIIGLFTGFISAISKDITIQKEIKIDMRRDFLRPDLIIEFDGESVILEFKRNRIEKNITISRTQMIKYLIASEIKTGVIIYFNQKNFEEINVEKNILTDYDMTFKILEIY